LCSIHAEESARALLRAEPVRSSPVRDPDSVLSTWKTFVVAHDCNVAVEQP
jgi:hypothetical protein